MWNSWLCRALNSRLAWRISSALISAGYAMRTRQLLIAGVFAADELGLSDVEATSKRC